MDDHNEIFDQIDSVAKRQLIVRDTATQALRQRLTEAASHEEAMEICHILTAMSHTALRWAGLLIGEGVNGTAMCEHDHEAHEDDDL